MNKNQISVRIFFVVALPVLIFNLIISCKGNPENNFNVDKQSVQHEVVYYEDGRFGAWPANGGMWAWDDEILVCFSSADHMDKSGHTYDVSTSKNLFARSLDGGETWAVEDAYEQGITGYAMDHRDYEEYDLPKDLDKPIDFFNPNFAFLFQRETNKSGPSHFYYTYDRGKSWEGPYLFPDLDPAGITSRTDYIIDGRHEMLVFLSIGHGRTGVASTIDGGVNWELISYVGPDFTRSEEILDRNDYSLMPSTVRLSENKILTTIRHREGDEGKVWITGYLSEDNARTWKRLNDPVKDNVNSPPALIRLSDGSLVLAYIFRDGGWGQERYSHDGSKVCAKISVDDGYSWSDEIILRGGEGANSDVGYPRIVMRSDGKLIITYYWNHSNDKGKDPYRYIAATIWDIDD